MGAHSHFQKLMLHIMKYSSTGLNCLFALVCLAGSGCSLGHSVSDDLKSTNPAVVLQAQKVVDLQQQVDAQENAVKDRERAVAKQKDEADAEKSRLEALKNQLDGAKQNLKGVKTQAKMQ
jgi:hypothetical protein